MRARLADPTHCPGPDCHEPVPEWCRQLQSRYTCRKCGRWVLDTGAYCQPVCGPPGTPAEYIQVEAPHWEAIDTPPTDQDPSDQAKGSPAARPPIDNESHAIALLFR